MLTILTVDTKKSLGKVVVNNSTTSIPINVEGNGILYLSFNKYADAEKFAVELLENLRYAYSEQFELLYDEY